MTMPNFLEITNPYLIAVKASFFIPGWVVEQNRAVVERIHAEGHEIGHHGYMHEWPHILSLEEEEEILKKGIDIISSVTNKSPLGYRSPAWEFSENTIGLLQKYNFLYSSNMMDDDKAYKHVINGEKTDLVELPVHFMLDDAPFFVWNFSISGRTIRSVSEVYQIWADEFDAMYEDKGCFVLSLHPQAIGRASRMVMLEKFIDYVLEKPDVRFVTCSDTANKFKDNDKAIDDK